jgi:hypothetical protein
VKGEAQRQAVDDQPPAPHPSCGPVRRRRTCRSRAAAEVDRAEEPGVLPVGIEDEERAQAAPGNARHHDDARRARWPAASGRNTNGDRHGDARATGRSWRATYDRGKK